MPGSELFSNHILALLDVINSYGLGLWNIAGTTLTLDQKTAAIIGVSAGPMELGVFLELVNEADRQGILDGLKETLETPGRDGHVEFRVFNREMGVYRWVRVMGKSYLNQGKKVVLGTTQIIEGKALDLLNERINAMTRELNKKQQLHDCLFEVTEVLLNADDSVFEQTLQQSLGIIGRALDLARVYMYKNHLFAGALCCTQIYEWTADGIESTLGEEFTKDMPYHTWPGLEGVLEAGENYNRLAKNIPNEIREMIPQGVKTILFVPVFLKDLLWGFVGYDRTSEEPFSADEESSLASAALLLANSVIRFDLNKNLYLAVDKINTTTIKAEEFEKAAYTDPLTGLYNRRHFMELAQTALEKSKRFNTVCYAMILDLDFFKKVNDTYGHLAGDEMLKNASTVIKNALRAYDLLARYGGEEFVVLISETTKEDTLSLAERIREAIANIPCVYNCIKIAITISIGVAAGTPDSTIMDLIDRADKGLYKAKENGRNQVVFFE